MDSLLRSELGREPARLPWREALEPLVQELRAGHRPADTSFSVKVAAVSAVLAGEHGIAPVLEPSDTDLVPSLAFERHRGGCTSLAIAWILLGAEVGLALEPVLLPGHMTLRDASGRFVEPLRGIERSASFYDSAFQLGRRPAYRELIPNPRGIEAAMCVQGGLLAWKGDRLDVALEAFRTATELAPGLPEAEGNLGLVFESLGQKDSARVHLALAVAGDSLNAAARMRLDRLR